MLKNRHNHKIYLEIISKMTAEQKINKMFELSEYAKELFIQ